MDNFLKIISVIILVDGVVTGIRLLKLLINLIKKDSTKKSVSYLDSKEHFENARTRRRGY
jgi:hypothetical protein